MAHSPLAQFFNNNNCAQMPRQMPQQPKQKVVSAPPGFNGAQRTQAQPQKALLTKETKLITPTMFAPSNNNNNTVEKKPTTVEPLTKNQLLQALNYLIANDEEFNTKIHEAYIKSFKTLAS